MKWASLPTARGRKTILWIVLSMPLLWLAVLVIQELRLPNSGLGPEPTEALLHYLGEWSLISLLLAFSVSPLRRRAKLGMARPAPAAHWSIRVRLRLSARACIRGLVCPVSACGIAR